VFTSKVQSSTQPVLFSLDSGKNTAFFSFILLFFSGKKSEGRERGKDCTERKGEQKVRDLSDKS